MNGSYLSETRIDLDASGIVIRMLASTTTPTARFIERFLTAFTFEDTNFKDEFG